MEVERKFRLREPPDLSGADSDPIEQGYLAVGAEGEVRLRRKGERTLLTVKRGAGLSRGEVEVEVTPEQFEALWPLTEGRRLRKRRYVLPHDELQVEVDVYERELAGLTVAEIEFDSEEQARAFEPPAWLGDEVTGDERFLNENLAAHGAPEDA
jgi:CYTH domain-containing protein